MAHEIVKIGSGQVTLTDLPLSALAIAVLQKTSNAEFAPHEFFGISNEHTRRAYGRIVSRFLIWCDEGGLALHNITPGLAGAYMQTLEGAAPTKNQALAALRHFFDFLLNRHAVPLNSFSTVRGI